MERMSSKAGATFHSNLPDVADGTRNASDVVVWVTSATGSSMN